MMKINIELSEWQAEQMEDLFNHVKIQDKNGTPGMLLAQIWIDPGDKSLPVMEVRFIDSEKSKSLQVAMGQEVGKIANGETIDAIAPL